MELAVEKGYHLSEPRTARIKGSNMHSDVEYPVGLVCERAEPH